MGKGEADAWSCGSGGAVVLVRPSGVDGVVWYLLSTIAVALRVPIPPGNGYCRARGKSCATQRCLPDTILEARVLYFDLSNVFEGF